MDRESRRMPRRAVTGQIDVFDAMTDVLVGQPRNMSVGGMLLMAGTLLVEDALYQFRFTLPDGIDRAIEVGAHVLWRDEVSASAHSFVGVRFLGLSPEATRLLREWVRQDADAS